MGEHMIRDATLADLPFMLNLGREMFCESRFSKNFEFDVTKGLRMLRAHIESPEGIAIVSEHGMIVGAVEEHWFAQGLRADDRIIYVSKEHRRGREGLMLIRAYMKKARELGAREIHIGNGAAIVDGRLGKLFERLGFERMGDYYVKEA